MLTTTGALSQSESSFRRVPPRGTPRVPAPLPLSPFSPPDRDRRGDSPAARHRAVVKKNHNPLSLTAQKEGRGRKSVGAKETEVRKRQKVKNTKSSRRSTQQGRERRAGPQRAFQRPPPGLGCCLPPPNPSCYPALWLPLGPKQLTAQAWLRGRFLIGG